MLTERGREEQELLDEEAAKYKDAQLPLLPPCLLSSSRSLSFPHVHVHTVRG
jgi:hypothetical protein